MSPETEAHTERIWRERCAEPCPDRYPIRCRRDLNHPDGHLGLSYTLTDPGHREPAPGSTGYRIVGMRWREDHVAWPGHGNDTSAYGRKCWCPRS